MAVLMRLAVTDLCCVASHHNICFVTRLAYEFSRKHQILVILALLWWAVIGHIKEIMA